MYYLCEEIKSLRFQRYKKIIQTTNEMRRYYFELLDENNNDLGAMIPDGSDKRAAIKKARRWMNDNDIKKAVLSVNSMRTGNLLDAIDIELI